MYQYQMLRLLNLIAGVTNSLKMSPNHPGMFRPFQGPCRWCRVSMASASLRNIDLEQSGRKKDEKGSWIMRYIQFYTRSRYTLHLIPLIPPFQTDPTYFEPKISEISIWGSLSSSWSSPTFWLPVWDLNFWTFFNVDETWMSLKKATWATLWLSTWSTGLSTVISSNFASDARLSDCHRLSFNGLFGSSSFPSKAGDVSTNAPRRTRFMAHGTVRFHLICHERLPRTSGFLSTRLSRCNTGESLDILQMYEFNKFQWPLQRHVSLIASPAAIPSLFRSRNPGHGFRASAGPARHREFCAQWGPVSISKTTATETWMKQADERFSDIILSEYFLAYVLSNNILPMPCHEYSCYRCQLLPTHTYSTCSIAIVSEMNHIINYMTHTGQKKS